MPTTTLNYITIYYEIHGKGDPLLILGGLGDTTRNWQAIASHLGKDRQVILMDNRGSGQSDRPKGPYNIKDMAKDSLALLDHLNIEECDILGFSMGGKIALYIAHNIPRRIEKLILMATSPSWKTQFPPAPEIHGIMDSFDNTDEHFAKQFEMLYAEPYKKRFPAENYIRFKQTEELPQSQENFADQLSASQSFDVSRQLRQIKHPTLIIQGDSDVIARPENAELLASKLPNAKLISYPNVGHIPQLEASGDFLKDVNEFLLHDE
jgi:3-oxoadipate enol-lactonase